MILKMNIVREESYEISLKLPFFLSKEFVSGATRADNF